MNPRREYGAALLLCALGGALLVLAASRDWVRADAFGGRTVLAESVSAGAVRALGLAALAGVVGVAATQRRARRAVGVVLVLIGGLAIAFVADALANPTPGGMWVGGTPPGTSTHWPWVAAVGATLVCASGVAVVIRGSRWGALSLRYGGPAAEPAPITEIGLWDAQSRGDDPT